MDASTHTQQKKEKKTHRATEAPDPRNAELVKLPLYELRRARLLVGQLGYRMQLAPKPHHVSLELGLVNITTITVGAIQFVFFTRSGERGADAQEEEEDEEEKGVMSGTTHHEW